MMFECWYDCYDDDDDLRSWERGECGCISTYTML